METTEIVAVTRDAEKPKSEQTRVQRFVLPLPWLPALLHRANSYAQWIDKDSFYELKFAILEQRGTPDGFDVQFFPGKDCWSCDGSGTFYHTYSGDPATCYKCGGSGWYHHPKWIQLPRWRFGRFVFHSVGPIAYHRDDADAWGEPAERFRGFVSHRDYSYRQQKIAHVLLGLCCDRGYLLRAIRDLWHWSRLNRFLNQRCVDCKCRVFPLRRSKWRCGVCERVRQRLPDELPF